MRGSDDRDSWRSYPDTTPKRVIPTSPDKVHMPVIDSPAKDNPQTFREQKAAHRRAAREDGVTAPTELTLGRATWGEVHGEVHGGAANYYKEVKVCGVCAQVYSLLDQSRDLVFREEEKKMEEDKIKNLSDYTDQRDYSMGRDHKVHGRHQHEGPVMGAEGEGDMGIMSTQLGRQLFSVSLNNPLGLDDSTRPAQLEGITEDDDLDTMFLSPVKTKGGKAQFANSIRSPSLPKPRATWKDHLTEDEDLQAYDEQKEKKSGKKGKKKKSKDPEKLSDAQKLRAKGNDPHFEQLDDYLKGHHKMSHTVASRKAEQLQGGRSTQIKLNQESRRYHAKILIGDENKETATKAKKALEPCGYIVNWVENGADCVELMEQTHYDAIILAKDMAGELKWRRY